jgi:hypothetical protein
MWHDINTPLKDMSQYSLYGITFEAKVDYITTTARERIEARKARKREFEKTIPSIIRVMRPAWAIQAEIDGHDFAEKRQVDDVMQDFFNNRIFGAVPVAQQERRDALPPASAIPVKSRPDRTDGTFDADRAFSVLLSFFHLESMEDDVPLDTIKQNMKLLWDNFNPGGVPMSNDEREEVDALFDVWTDLEGFGKIGTVNFKQFKAWFINDVCANINRASPLRLRPSMAKQVGERERFSQVMRRQSSAAVQYRRPSLMGKKPPGASKA